MTIDKTGEFIPDHPLEVRKIVEWMQSLVGTSIRGHKVIDVDFSMSVDFSVFVKLKIANGHNVLEKELLDPRDTDELVWHTADVRVMLLIEPEWMYWDEFATSQL